MPTSRSRRSRNVSANARKRERRRSAQHARDDAGARPRRGTNFLAGEELHDMIERFTQKDFEALGECARREACGDAAGALALQESTPWAGINMQGQNLREMVGLGVEAPQWVLCRWVVQQAYRWLITQGDRRVDEAMMTTFETAYQQVDPDRPLGMEPMDFTRRLIASDWICHQLALYDFVGLTSYVTEVVDATLRERVPLIEEWAATEIGGYCLREVRNDTLVVLDLGTGDLLEVLHLGLTWTLDAGSCVLGRLVPTGASPALMFAGLPLEVDPSTARSVAASREDPTAWLRQVAVAVATGSLPGDNCLQEPISLVSDLPGGSPSGLVHEGAARGDQLPGVELCAFVLDEVAAEPGTASHLAPVLLSVLLEPPVLDRLRTTGIGRRDGWRAIAACLPQPFRQRCLELALQCGEHPAA